MTIETTPPPTPARVAVIGLRQRSGQPAIPTEPQALYEFLRKLAPGAQCEVADLLAVQLGGTPAAIDHAVDLVGRALRHIAHDDMIAELREHLAERITTAIDTIKDAKNTVDRLAAAGDVFDVEYAEGGQRVSDLRGFLDDAGRMARAAAAVNPCPPDTGGAS